jgi:non-specific serine/threonine protein kinase/serine/threonine-protein kinase
MSEAEQAGKNGHNEEHAIPTANMGSGYAGPGGQIGQYKLLRILGEGGFAVVYLAEQQEPVKRRVALKVIKPGMDSKQVIARFGAERQALALLDHPNIARVHDGGATEEGRPYFVMEYVSGLPITDYCDRQKLSLEQRLELFRHVCEGVQHAHQKGIIHRDIKPSNILVHTEGDKAIPKIIDFGIAKATSRPLTEQTLFTEQGRLIGTPEYMSPEQVDDIQDIDTRSDVYSLGVLLYELLTGALPFDPKTLREGGLDNFRRVVVEQEPKTPSWRLNSLADQAGPIAQRRGTDVAILVKRLRRELEWIPLKAMRKDRSRRYRSASELADDIGNYLAGAPLLAGPESTLYRMGKWVRRRRAIVYAATVVLVVLVLAAIVSIVFAVRESRAHGQTRAVVDFLTDDLLGLVDPQQSGTANISVRDILDGASMRLQGKFEAEPMVEAPIRMTLGTTYMNLGEYKAAQPHLERALQLYQDHLGRTDLTTVVLMDSLVSLYSRQGRGAKALSLCAELYEMRCRLLGKEDTMTLASMQRLGQMYLFQGQPEKAEPLLVGALQICRRVRGEADLLTTGAMSSLASLYYIQGKTNKAEQLLVRALEIQQQLGGQGNTLTLHSTSGLAVHQYRQGRHEEGLALAEKTLEQSREILGDEDPMTLTITATVARLYVMQEQYDHAQQLLTEAQQTSRRVLGEAHSLVLQLSSQLGDLYSKQGRHADALPLFTEVFETRRRVLGPEHDRTLSAVRDLIHLCEASDKPEDAEKWRAKLPQKEAVEE